MSEMKPPMEHKGFRIDIRGTATAGLDVLEAVREHRSGVDKLLSLLLAEPVARLACGLAEEYPPDSLARVLAPVKVVLASYWVPDEVDNVAALKRDIDTWREEAAFLRPHVQQFLRDLDAARKASKEREPNE